MTDGSCPSGRSAQRLPSGGSKYIMPFTVGWVLYNPKHSPACVSRVNASVITGVRICRRQLTRFRAEGLQRGTACERESRHQADAYDVENSTVQESEAYCHNEKSNGCVHPDSDSDNRAEREYFLRLRRFINF